MPILTADFPDLVANMKVEWDKKFKEMPQFRDRLAIKIMAEEQTKKFSSISSLPTADIVDEDDAVVYVKPKQGYTSEAEIHTIRIGVAVTEAMRDFDKYDEIMGSVRGATDSTIRRLEQDVQFVLANAFATSYSRSGRTISVAGPDGLALISGAHTVRANSDTWTNQLSSTHLPISPSVHETLKQLFNKFVNPADGRKITVKPNTYICAEHAPTEFEIDRILLSTQQPDTANNAINPEALQKKITRLSLPWLNCDPDEGYNSNKDRYCFLALLGDPDISGIVRYLYEEAGLVPPEQVFDTGTWKFQAKAKQDTIVRRQHWIVGTKGDSTSV